MPNSYTDKGYVTNDPVIAAMFLDKKVWFDKGDSENVTLNTIVVHREEGFPGVLYFCEEDVYQQCLFSVTIPYAAIKAAITPVEGKPCFFIYGGWDDSRPPDYSPRLPGRNAPTTLLACPITLGKTVGELRELLAAIEEHIGAQGV